MIKIDHLLGREFNPPEFDCYSFAQAVYKDICGIQLGNYARPNDWWLDPNFNLYKDNFETEGFQLIETRTVRDLRVMDGLMIALPDPRNIKRVVANHCAIYIGDGKIAHHLLGHRSCIEEYRGAFRNFTVGTIRHKDVPNLEPEEPTKLQMIDFLLPSKRALVMGAINDKKSIT